MTAALIVHGLLVLLFLRAGRGIKAIQPEGIVRTRILYLVRLPQKRLQGQMPTGETPRRTPRRFSRAPPAFAPAVAQPGETSRVAIQYHPTLDWHQAAGEVARSLTDWHGTKVHPGSGEHPLSPYRDCERQAQFAWDPQPQRVGLIDHWLPYLRLGNHCIVTLGMFGCVVGRLPEPNGQLFDRILVEKATQNSTPAVRSWPDGEPRGLCQPLP